MSTPASRVLVLGAAGQVGSALCRARWPDGTEVTGLARAELDITDPGALGDALARHAPTAVVNAVAYTAVDKAESERDAAMAVNATAPGLIAGLCARSGARLVHISTDYVFDGSKAAPYVETDPTNPINVYGESKLAGEQAVAAAGGGAAILRTSWVYDAGERNFVGTMLRLAKTRDELNVVDDQVGAPTSAADIADAIVAIVAAWAAGRGGEGLFHLSGAGETSWCGFARAIFEEAAARGLATPRVNPIATAQYPTPARRPLNSRMDCSRLGQVFDVRPPHWRDSLARSMAERLGS
jgi:dTDP-4-dehydrorhamnose reductase